jgi:hypothetical protein
MAIRGASLTILSVAVLLVVAGVPVNRRHRGAPEAARQEYRKPKFDQPRRQPIEHGHVGRHCVRVTIEIVVECAVAREHRSLSADHRFRLREFVLRPKLNHQVAQHRDTGDRREHYKDTADLDLDARSFGR